MSELFWSSDRIPDWADEELPWLDQLEDRLDSIDSGDIVDFDREPEVPVQICRNREPEPHQAGEFPMSCYPCHMVADS